MFYENQSKSRRKKDLKVFENIFVFKQSFGLLNWSIWAERAGERVIHRLLSMNANIRSATNDTGKLILKQDCLSVILLSNIICKKRLAEITNLIISFLIFQHLVNLMCNTIAYATADIHQLNVFSNKLFINRDRCLRAPSTFLHDQATI